MKSLEFFAPSDPKAQPRMRAFKRGAHAGVYDPGTAEAWKFCVRGACKDVWDGFQFKGPLRVRLDFLFTRPKHHFRSGSKSHELRYNAPTWHVQKPDRDNLEKAVLDALSSLGIWVDDAQVCCGEVTKLWAGSSSSGCRIFIQEVEE